VENNPLTLFSILVPLSAYINYTKILGSTALFVNSALCTDFACLTHDQYDPLSSDTLAVTDPLLGLEVEYGSGTVEGVLVQEDLYIGDMKVDDFILFLISQQEGVLDNVF
jgi:hypothetical protein